MAHRIKNFDSLARTPLRKTALDIVETGLAAIDTDTALRSQITCVDDTLHIGNQSYHLAQYQHVYILGCGKVACRAAVTLEEILGARVKGGAVIGVSHMVCDTISLYQGTHPKPSEANFAAAQHMMTIGSNVTQDDLVLVIVGGGGSALLCATEQEAEQNGRLYDTFLASGGTIEEINLVRRHLSPLKGGGLAQALYPATVVGLIFSDVLGGDMSAVASGPTYYDESTNDDAQRVIEKYALGSYELTETPKDKKFFENVSNIEIVSSMTAVRSMEQKAHELGYAVVVPTLNPYTNTTDMAQQLMQEAKPGTAVIFGCEPGLVVDPECNGEGGRMSFLALEILEHISDGSVCVALASDGRDNSEYAGAVVDITTQKIIDDASITLDEYAVCRNSNPVFQITNDLIETGVLESNISDIVLILTPHE